VERATEGKVVVFSVGGQEYALPIAAVREIINWTAPTPVPESPPWVDGVISVRGEVMPVVAMARRFGLPQQRTGDDARIIILEVGGRSAGLIVDDVVAVESVETAGMAPHSSVLGHLGGAAEAVVEAILRLGENHLVVLLDASRVVATALQ